VRTLANIATDITKAISLEQFFILCFLLDLLFPFSLLEPGPSVFSRAAVAQRAKRLFFLERATPFSAALLSRNVAKRLSFLERATPFSAAFFWNVVNLPALSHSHYALPQTNFAPYRATCNTKRKQAPWREPCLKHVTFRRQHEIACCRQLNRY